MLLTLWTLQLSVTTLFYSSATEFDGSNFIDVKTVTQNLFTPVSYSVCANYVDSS